MLADNQEDLVKTYIQTYLCEMEKDGIRKVLNPDIERFLYDNAVQFAKMKTVFGERISENDGKRYLQYLNFV